VKGGHEAGSSILTHLGGRREYFAEWVNQPGIFENEEHLRERK